MVPRSVMPYLSRMICACRCDSVFTVAERMAATAAASLFTLTAPNPPGAYFDGGENDAEPGNTGDDENEEEEEEEGGTGGDDSLVKTRGLDDSPTSTKTSASMTPLYQDEDDDEDEDEDEENEEDEAEDEDKSAEGVEGNDSVLAAGAEKDNAEEDEEDADDAAGAPMVVPPRRSVSVSVLASMGTVAWVKDQRRRSSSSCATDSLA